MVIATGFVLLFPFYGTTVANMELAEIVHSVVAVLYVSAMFVHIYMGTIGVEGAFEAMAEGTVDVNWAKERHSLWYEEEMQGGAAQGQAHAAGRIAGPPRSAIKTPGLAAGRFAIRKPCASSVSPAGAGRAKPR